MERSSAPVRHDTHSRSARPLYGLALRLALALLLSQLLIPLQFPSVPHALAQASTSMVDVGNEIEPNGTAATATALGGTNVRITGTIYPNADVDYYAFNAVAGDRVYAATMTSASSNGSTDSVIDLIGSDGTTVLESDDQNGSLGGNASSIAGTVIPTTGTYYLRVKHFSLTIQLRPYDLYLQVQSGTPTAEVELNDTFPGQTLPTSGWITGVTSSTTDIDLYSLTLAAGDTVFLSLDLDPERDNVEWNGALGLGPFDSSATFLVVNDSGDAGFDSEAFFITVKEAGTYSAYVKSGSTTFGSYHLSVSVLPAPIITGCTTYTSTNVPQTIPAGPSSVTSTITIPNSQHVSSLKVTLNLTHTNMLDLDVHLAAPEGNVVGLFTDIGNTTYKEMNLTLDDDAAITVNPFTVVSGIIVRPENSYLLDWFRGQQAQGTWTLIINDDTANNGGVLQSWGLTVCTEPLIGPEITLFSSDFEANDGGFTSSGTQNEWQWGTPSAAPITTCNSGSQCWKTDLTGTYNADSNQELLSPPIDLTTVTGTVILRWAMKYQIESATFDAASVEVREVGNPSNSTIRWQWLGATMTTPVGNPSTTIQETAGWGEYSGDISAFAGKVVEVRFHLASDLSIQLAGLAIDDVRVTTPAIAIGGLSASNDSPTLLGNTTNLTATVVSGSEPITYTWDFGDGTTGSGASATHTYAAIGSYTATVTATNLLGSVSTTTPVTITLPVQVGSTSSSVSVNEGQTALQSGTVTDLTSRPVTITASIGTITQTVGAWSWSYPTSDGPDESQTVTVTGTNSLGATATTTFTLTVNNIAPTFDVGTDETITTGTFSRSAIAFSDPGDETWSGTVNYGDGSGSQLLSIDQEAQSFALSHTYTANGSYTVTVTVTDGDTTTTDSFIVTVDMPNPQTTGGKVYLPVVVK